MTTDQQEGPPLPVLAYSRTTTEHLLAVGGAEVVAVYLHGSAVLGGWRAQVSDVDVLVVLAHEVAPEVATELGEAAASTIPACPGTGLELSAVIRSAAAVPEPPWPFVVHVAGNGEGQPTVVLGAGHPGDPDLLLHYAVCREVGWPVAGPPAIDVIGAVARPAVLHALAHELDWGLVHAAAPYALLNACRALVYLREGRLVAKLTGAYWALDRGIGPSVGIRGAIADQVTGRPLAKLTNADVDFIQHTALRLRQPPSV